jgi:hypothetical protein
MAVTSVSRTLLGQTSEGFSPQRVEAGMARVCPPEPTTRLTEARRMRLVLLGGGFQHSRSPGMRNGVKE